MFGFIIPNFKTLNDAEKSRYQGIYCGLCHSLRDKYNNISRLAMSFDLTFLTLFLTSLFEPEESESYCNCIFHPGKKYSAYKNKYSDFCADVTVMLAYHKLLDDVNDDHRLRAHLGKAALENQYAKVHKNIPDLCEKTKILMDKITELENSSLETKNPDIKSEFGDKISKTFGMIMANIFSYKCNLWTEEIAKFGAFLGQFIFYMDACIDLQNDIKTNSYNPYKVFYPSIDFNDNDQVKTFAKEQKSNLKAIIGYACENFEKIPLEKDINILRNILYEGCWIKFNQKFFKEN